jgi:iron uptake system component EfeO
VPPKKTVDGAAGLLGEVASSKIPGEEDRYSHTDLRDFLASIDGAEDRGAGRAAGVEGRPGLIKAVNDNFATVDGILLKYKTANGLETYDKLSDADRKAPAGPVTALAEDLSKLRGTLG